MRYFSVPALFLCVASAIAVHAEGYAPWPLILMGGGVDKQLSGPGPYRERETSVVLEGSVYRIRRPLSTWNVLTPGFYAGIEFGDLAARPYLGVSEWLLGIGRVPVLNFGASSCVMTEISRYKAYYADVGAEASVWMGTPVGTLKLSERFMLQDPPQTRLVYLIKLIAPMDPVRN
ncbi:MAG TPA: hypothetical protein VHO02_07150 [Fibrobacteria bacterium]|jgi:hypothetical protein|nr:hypothetical protein [Fibrobacteria bacterium]